MSGFVRKHARLIRMVVGLIVLGLLLKFLESYLAAPSHEGSLWPAFGLELLNHAAIACFSVALLGVILETRHFYEYFHTLIVETIIDKRFLIDLREDKLEQLKKKCLETFFQINELDKEEGFYNFYLEKIEKHIGGPFRENTTAVTIIKFAEDRQSFIAKDEVTYTCRKLGEVIQESAGWTAEQDEIMEVSEFEITVTKPGGAPLSRGYKTGEVADPALEPYSQGHGFTFPLKEYCDVDGLQINVKAVYVVPLERPFSWTMPCLSHNFDGSIEYPGELVIFFDSFGLDESALPRQRPEEKDGRRTYHFKHKSWLLPDDGFSYHFRQPQTRPQTPPQPPPPMQSPRSAEP
jgi:hypothetical protein